MKHDILSHGDKAKNILMINLILSCTNLDSNLDSFLLIFHYMTTIRIFSGEHIVSCYIGFHCL